MLNFINLPTCHVVEDVSLYGSLLTTVSCHLQQITWGITSLVISQDPCPYISSYDFLLCPLLFQAKLHLPVTPSPIDPCPMTQKFYLMPFVCPHHLSLGSHQRDSHHILPPLNPGNPQQPLPAPQTYPFNSFLSCLGYGPGFTAVH